MIIILLYEYHHYNDYNEHRPQNFSCYRWSMFASLWKIYLEFGLIIFYICCHLVYFLVAFRFLEKQNDFCVHLIALCVEFP